MCVLFVLESQVFMDLQTSHHVVCLYDFCLQFLPWLLLTIDNNLQSQLNRKLFLVRILYHSKKRKAEQWKHRKKYINEKNCTSVYWHNNYYTENIYMVSSNNFTSVQFYYIRSTKLHIERMKDKFMSDEFPVSWWWNFEVKWYQYSGELHKQDGKGP